MVSLTVRAEEPVIEKTPAEGSLIVIFWWVPLVKDSLNIVVISDIDFVVAESVIVLVLSTPTIPMFLHLLKLRYQ